MAPKKVRDAPPDKPLEGSDEAEAEAEAIDLESEEPPRKKQKQFRPEFKRSQQILEGDNHETRDDLQAEVGFYGNDGPAADVNAGPALSASEAFLRQQMEMKDYRAELEASFSEDKAKEIKKAIIKQAKKEAQNSVKLDGIEYGRQEFERKKANLRIEIERELRPKIEREIRAMIERERVERERVEAEKTRKEVDEERGEVVFLDD